MKPHVLTTMTSALGRVVDDAEARARCATPSMTSVSTRFFGQPRLTKWIVFLGMNGAECTGRTRDAPHVSACRRTRRGVGAKRGKGVTRVDGGAEARGEAVGEAAALGREVAGDDCVVRAGRDAREEEIALGEAAEEELGRGRLPVARDVAPPRGDPRRGVEEEQRAAVRRGVGAEARGDRGERRSALVALDRRGERPERDDDREAEREWEGRVDARAEVARDEEAERDAGDERERQVVVAAGILQEPGKRRDERRRAEEREVARRLRQRAIARRHCGARGAQRDPDAERRQGRVGEARPLDWVRRLHAHRIEGEATERRVEERDCQGGERARDDEHDERPPAPREREDREERDAEARAGELRGRRERRHEDERRPPRRARPRCFAQDERRRDREEEEQEMVGVHRRGEQVRQPGERDHEDEPRRADWAHRARGGRARRPERPREDRDCRGLFRDDERAVRDERELDVRRRQERVVREIDERRIGVRVEARQVAVERLSGVELQGVHEERPLRPERLEGLRRHRRGPRDPRGERRERRAEAEDDRGARRARARARRGPRDEQRRRRGRERRVRERAQREGREGRVDRAAEEREGPGRGRDDRDDRWRRRRAAEEDRRVAREPAPVARHAGPRRDERDRREPQREERDDVEPRRDPRHEERRRRRAGRGEEQRAPLRRRARRARCGRGDRDRAHRRDARRVAPRDPRAAHPERRDGDEGRREARQRHIDSRNRSKR